MRQAQVQNLFLRQFSEHYPRLSFRGLRRFPGRAFGPYDFALRVGLGDTKLELDLLAIVLGDGFPQDVERLLESVRETALPASDVPRKPILVAPHLTEASRALCRQYGVGSFDLAGNALLEADQLFVWVMGKENPYSRERQINSPFRGKAERIVRQLLLSGDQRWTMRRLANAAQVSLGLTSATTTTLAEMGVVIKTRRGMDLYDPAALLQGWSTHYDLRQSALRIYRCSQEPDVLLQRLLQAQSQRDEAWALTLWSGANTLLELPLVKPRLAIYYQGAPDKLASILDLSAQGGNTSVFIFQPYDESLLWETRKTAEGLVCVHPLQLYLDLSSGDQEELALAEKVRERLLDFA